MRSVLIARHIPIFGVFLILLVDGVQVELGIQMEATREVRAKSKDRVIDASTLILWSIFVNLQIILIVIRLTFGLATLIVL